VFNLKGAFVFNHIKLFVLVVLLCSSSVVVAQQPTLPKYIQAEYTATKNGLPFATVSEKFVVLDNTYNVESITKGIGIYALFGERKLSSVGDVTAQGLKPNRFELHQGDNAKKSLIAEFDWAKQNLLMTVKGKVKEANLLPGTQDLVSYAYQFMYLPAPLAGDITVALTTGKKLNQYQYKINPTIEVIDVAGVRYKTIHLQQAEENKPETKELWLAAEHYYLPVRILMIDENEQKIEQTLTELKFN
jgi:hypothetical protein